MAGYTYREVVYDIWQSLKQNFDDGELTLAQVLYHVSVSANRLKYQHLNNELKESNTIGGDYLRVYSGIPIQSLNTSRNPNVIKNQKFIVLPARIIDLPRDGGIKFITYDHLDPNCCYGPNQVNFTRITPGFGIKRLYGNPYEKPSEANPYFYTVEDESGNGVKIYLLGLECSSIAKLQIGCYAYTTAGDIKSLDDILDLPEHLIEVLKYNVISLGKFVLATGSDNINDGQNTPSAENGLSRADQLYQQQVTQQLQGGN
jgi:hypothetical protein